MPPKHRRTRIGFALFGVLAILSLFVLDGALAGLAALMAMLVFIGACVYVLRGEDPQTVSRAIGPGLPGGSADGSRATQTAPRRRNEGIPFGASAETWD